MAYAEAQVQAPLSLSQVMHGVDAQCMNHAVGHQGPCTACPSRLHNAKDWGLGTPTMPRVDLVRHMRLIRATSLVQFASARYYRLAEKAGNKTLGNSW